LNIITWTPSGEMNVAHSLLVWHFSSYCTYNPLHSSIYPVHPLNVDFFVYILTFVVWNPFLLDMNLTDAALCY
jgi:hypothetical protein